MKELLYILTVSALLSSTACKRNDATQEHNYSAGTTTSHNLSVPLFRNDRFWRFKEITVVIEHDISTELSEEAIATMLTNFSCEHGWIAAEYYSKAFYGSIEFKRDEAQYTALQRILLSTLVTQNQK